MLGALGVLVALAIGGIVDQLATVLVYIGVALFLALGIMFYRARHAPPSDTRRAITTGFITGCFVLAALGLSEWISGNAGPGILLAVAVVSVR